MTCVRLHAKLKVLNTVLPGPPFWHDGKKFAESLISLSLRQTNNPEQVDGGVALVLDWSRKRCILEEPVPLNLSVKNVPDDLVERLRKRAKRHHRSVQGELMVILEEATGPTKLSVDEAERRLSALGFRTGDDSATWVRELRDAR